MRNVKIVKGMFVKTSETPYHNASVGKVIDIPTDNVYIVDTADGPTTYHADELTAV